MSAIHTGGNASSPGEFTRGAEVELVDNLVAADVERLRAYRVLGKRPAGSVNGLDYFGVFTSQRARVIRQEGSAVQVQILGGNWTGREGWVASEGIRVPPTEAESSADAVERLSENTRREIYAAFHAAGMKASQLANSRYPFDRMPIDAAAARIYLDERSAAYQEAKAQGRCMMLEQYNIDSDQLDRIEAEGDNRKWPLWDGLEDERGPIPTFGPVDTDDRGRIVMTDGEWEARRDAAIRALGAVGDITDDTDTDERWGEAFRGMEGAS
jgi:hypothetical protein